MARTFQEYIQLLTSGHTLSSAELVEFSQLSKQVTIKTKAIEFTTEQACLIAMTACNRLSITDIQSIKWIAAAVYEQGHNGSRTTTDANVNSIHSACVRTTYAMASWSLTSTLQAIADGITMEYADKAIQSGQERSKINAAEIKAREEREEKKKLAAIEAERQKNGGGSKETEAIMKDTDPDGMEFKAVEKMNDRNDAAPDKGKGKGKNK